MDKKIFDKSSSFFKKEGFYVILFVCLCIVATVAVVTSKGNKPVKQQVAVGDKGKKAQTETGKVAGQPSVSYPNALEVNKNNTPDISVPKEGVNSAEVAKAVDRTMTKPVEGKLGRAFSDTPVYWDSTDSNRPNWGIDIQTELGKTVAAAADGIVKEVAFDVDDRTGMEVIIDHQNGLKTVYSNLDENIMVKKGDAVKKGTPIGKVGRTTLRAAYEKYGDHLHFEVLQNNQPVDPARYVKYEVPQTTKQQ